MSKEKENSITRNVFFGISKKRVVTQLLLFFIISVFIGGLYPLFLMTGFSIRISFIIVIVITAILSVIVVVQIELYLWLETIVMRRKFLVIIGALLWIGNLSFFIGREIMGITDALLGSFIAIQVILLILFALSWITKNRNIDERMKTLEDLAQKQVTEINTQIKDLDKKFDNEAGERKRQIINLTSETTSLSIDLEALTVKVDKLLVQKASGQADFIQNLQAVLRYASREVDIIAEGQKIMVAQRELPSAEEQ